MSEETKPAEEVQEAKPTEGGEFATKEDLKNLSKGIEKLAEKLNKSTSVAEEDDTTSDEDKPSNPTVSPVVKKLYTEQKPEIEEVWDEVEEEAKALGQDPIEYFESKKGWQLEAKARLEAKKEKERAKNNIDSPSSKITQDTKVDFSKIKPEQISKLDKDQREAYREYLRDKEGGVTIIRSH